MNKKNLALGAVVIAGVSYLAGILTAPKSGKETRKDILDKAVKARIEAEKKLKKTHSELKNLIAEAEKRSKRLKADGKKELEKAINQAKIAKEKAGEMISAIHNGEADDPNLQAVIEQARLAKTNLATYLKK